MCSTLLFFWVAVWETPHTKPRRLYLAGFVCARRALRHRGIKGPRNPECEWWDFAQNEHNKLYTGMRLCGTHISIPVAIWVQRFLPLLRVRARFAWLRFASLVRPGPWPPEERLSSRWHPAGASTCTRQCVLSAIGMQGWVGISGPAHTTDGRSHAVLGMPSTR